VTDPERPESEPSRRSGLDIAREALAAARAEAKRRGLRPGTSSSGRSSADGISGPTQRRRWRAAVAEERSGAHPDDRDPQPLAAALDRVVAERGWETEKAGGDVLGRWSAIAGPEIAEHAVPVSFDDGALLLQAETTAWATQLRLLAPQLLARLADELGAGVVRSVTVRGPSGPSWKRGPLSVRGRGPRDTYG
jgi:predicted nucleic acid-binding Zn ribbon protein